MPHRAVILTALPVEYLAVRSYLTELREDMSPLGTIYELGKFVTDKQVWEVVIVEVGVGNTVAALEAERAIARYNPEITLFVGIAEGIKGVAIGDVVVASNVYNYEVGRAAVEFIPRPSLVRSTQNLIQTANFQSGKSDWLQRLPLVPSPPPRVFIAPIASGEKVIASTASETYSYLRSNYSDVMAVDMEGFGFLSAAFAHPDIAALVIRGISDLIDSEANINTDAQESCHGSASRAASHASAFAFEILANFQDLYLEAVLSNSEFYCTFLDEILSLGVLNRLAVEDFNAQRILKRQIFISAVTCLETYLSDAFINTVLSKEKYLKSFFRSFKDFNDKKFGLNEIFDYFDKAEEIAKKAMLEVIFHNLPKVGKMYSSTFDIVFPDFSELQRDIATRHDLVHRNGKTKEGKEISVDEEAVNDVISRIKKFVNELDQKLKNKEKT
jgi:nucleoside phosphorylase